MLNNGKNLIYQSLTNNGNYVKIIGLMLPRICSFFGVEILEKDAMEVAQAIIIIIGFIMSFWGRYRVKQIHAKP